MTFVKRLALFRSCTSRPGETSWTSLLRRHSWRITSPRCLHGSKVWRILLFLHQLDQILRTSAEWRCSLNNYDIVGVSYRQPFSLTDPIMRLMEEKQINISKCVLKDLQKELQNQQGSIDSTRESLNTLCRKYPSEELAGLGSALTDLIKTYESVNQLSARTLASLQNCLQQQFNGEKSKKLNEICSFTK